MKEFEIQKEFFDSARSLREKSSSDIDIYEELIYIRFYDVISSCYPIFTKLIGENQLGELVKSFIKDKPGDPYIWNSPKEFLGFLKKSGLVTSKKELEVLKFELIELKLYLTNRRVKRSRFSWKKRLKISHNAAIEKVLYKPFDNDSFEKGKTCILIYLNLESNEVYHFTITPYMYIFLKLLRDNTPLKALKIVNRRFCIKDKKSKKILEEGLKFLAQNGILI